MGSVKEFVEEQLETIADKLNITLATKIDNEDGVIHPRKYGNLLNSAFNLSVAMRIERVGYVNNISGKTGDLTFETINKLIVEGRCDAWFTIIEKSINDAKLDDDNKLALMEALNLARQNLRQKDYEDNDSQTYQLLTKFIKKVKAEKKLETYQSAKLVKFTEELLTILN